MSPILPQVLHVARCLDPVKGGTSESIPALARATAQTGRFFNPLIQFGPADSPLSQACEDLPVSTLPWRPIRLLTSDDPDLRACIGRSQAVHVHGIWEPQCVAVGRTARSLRRPYVVSAHGMLERWALHHRRFRKQVYGALFERDNLQRAACLRALTRAELDDYRRYGMNGPVAIIPNGVNPRTVPSTIFLDRYPNLSGKRIVLFLSRIHKKKGIDMLCRVWPAIHTRFPDTHLVLAGPDFQDTLAGIRQLIADLRIADSVTLTGMLNNDLKWSALSAASLFVLPSYSEGFSMAVLEALAAGLPVIATHRCNFPDIETHNTGLLISPEQRQLEQALGDLLAAPPRDLSAMGGRGRELVAKRYTWSAIGEMMAQVYEWILGDIQPTSVEIDRRK